MLYLSGSLVFPSKELVSKPLSQDLIPVDHGRQLSRAACLLISLPKYHSVLLTVGKIPFNCSLSFSVGLRPHTSSALSESKRPMPAQAMVPKPIKRRVRGVRLRKDRLHCQLRSLLGTASGGEREGRVGCKGGTYCQIPILRGSVTALSL